MNYYNLFLLLSFLVVLFSNCSDKKAILIIDDVTVIDGTGKGPLVGSCIFIENGVITKISKKEECKYPRNALIINVGGKYAIPGFIETHDQLTENNYDYRLCNNLLASGITTMRISNGKTEDNNILPESVSNWKAKRPSIYSAIDLIEKPDTPNTGIESDISLREKLVLMVNSGIKPIDVIKIVTRNGAEGLDILDKTGTIEKGKQADILILNADPLDNIKNTQNIEIIINNGVIYHPSELLSQKNTESTEPRINN